MKITVEALVKGDLNRVERLEQSRGHQAVERRTVDLREGGAFSARMEAKDGAEGFDFEGTYTRVVPRELIEYRMSDGRNVTVQFSQRAGEVLVRETFDAESENSPEMQRAGWQAILDNFARHVRRQP